VRIQRLNAPCKGKKKRQRLSSPSNVLSGTDENWQRSFRAGRQWARIVKTSLPNHGGREQRQSPPLLRGHKLIRRGKGAPQVFSPRNAQRADRRSEVAREQRARMCYIPMHTSIPHHESRSIDATDRCFE